MNDQYNNAPLPGPMSPEHAAAMQSERCCDNGLFHEAHACQKHPGIGLSLDAVQKEGSAFAPPERLDAKGKPGRPKGFDGTRSRMPSALAQAFKANGLDWKKDFSDAIKANKRDRIKLWLRLLPYMITTSKRAKVGRWKGRPSRAARIALEAMEQDL